MIQVLWKDEKNRELMSLEHHIDFQRKKFDLLKDILKARFVQNKKKFENQGYLYFENLCDFYNSRSNKGFTSAVIVDVVQTETRKDLSVMDSSGIYTLRLQKTMEKEALMEGVQLGFMVRKREQQTSRISKSFNTLKDSLRAKKLSFDLDGYVFPKFGPTSWNNTSDNKVLIVSDVHVGNLTFCVQNFIALLNRASRDPKVKYVLINGDLVDGCEVYPGQKKDLQLYSFHEQYEKLASYLQLLREDIVVLLTPGNHDFTGRVEPQIFPQQVKSLFTSKLKNVVFGPNPGFYKIDGVYFYLTHGTSYNSVLKNVSYLDYNQCAQVTRYLADCRNVSPVKKAVPIFPNQNFNHLIPQQTNVICSGHMHNQDVKMYDQNRMLVATGAWQNLTPYMDLLGLKPDVSTGVCVDLSGPFKYEEWDLKDETTSNHTYQNALVQKKLMDQ